MLHVKKNAFTMIELVFVIVVLGILAAVAVPKLAATRVDAQISKGRAEVASIRSAIIAERQARLIKGESHWITKLHGATTKTFFDNNGSSDSSLLMYGVTRKAADGHWYDYNATAGATHSYSYRLQGKQNVFTYNPNNVAKTVNSVSVIPGGFVCTKGDFCSELTD